jgi:hypothetical protein
LFSIRERIEAARDAASGIFVRVVCIHKHKILKAKYIRIRIFMPWIDKLAPVFVGSIFGGFPHFLNDRQYSILEDGSLMSVDGWLDNKQIEEIMFVADKFNKKMALRKKDLLNEWL